MNIKLQSLLNAKEKYHIYIIKGLILGVANIIPGVSGGTMALVMGIYERLINALKNISPTTIISFFKLFTFKIESWNQFKKEMEKIDFVFLLLIFSGSLLSIFLLAKFTAYMITNQHDPTYGFFFGLILISIYFPFRIIKKKNAAVFLSIFLAITAINSTNFLMPQKTIIEKEQTKFQIELNEKDSKSFEKKYSLTKALVLFFAGALAVSAMILPGISGSFVLLMLGQYFVLIKAISEFNILYISATGLGTIFGLLLFTKILNLLLKKFHDITMAFLTGLVIGSLYIIWPFKNQISIGDSRVVDYPKTVFLDNNFPAQFSFNEISTILTVTGGCLIVIIMIFIEKKFSSKSKTN